MRTGEDQGCWGSPEEGKPGSARTDRGQLHPAQGTQTPRATPLLVSQGGPSMLAAAQSSLVPHQDALTTSPPLLSPPPPPADGPPPSTENATSTHTPSPGLVPSHLWASPAESLLPCRNRQPLGSSPGIRGPARCPCTSQPHVIHPCPRVRSPLELTPAIRMLQAVTSNPGVSSSSSGPRFSKEEPTCPGLSPCLPGVPSLLPEPRQPLLLLPL